MKTKKKRKRRKNDPVYFISLFFILYKICIIIS